MTHKLFSMPFSKVYPLYLVKIEKKGRNQEELNQVICWLTGYSEEKLAEQITKDVTFTDFFEEVPSLNPNVHLIAGMICGHRVEEIEDPLMQKIRYMDKLVDELAKGKPLEKILRQ